MQKIYIVIVYTLSALSLQAQCDCVSVHGVKRKTRHTLMCTVQYSSTAQQPYLSASLPPDGGVAPRPPACSAFSTDSFFSRKATAAVTFAVAASTRCNWSCPATNLTHVGNTHIVFRICSYTLSTFIRKSLHRLDGHSLVALEAILQCHTP